MTSEVQQLLDQLHRIGVVITVDAGDLVLRRSKSAIPAELLAEIRLRKVEVIRSLTASVDLVAEVPGLNKEKPPSEVSGDGTPHSLTPSTKPTKPADGADRVAGAAPTDRHARAAWLGRLARLAGIDAADLFRLIDDTFGTRTLGPYQLTTAEAERVANLLRAEVGKRQPIVEALRAADATIGDAEIPASIVLKTTRGWSDAQFASLCQRVLRRPGLRSAADDQAVHAAMLREGGNAR